MFQTLEHLPYKLILGWSTMRVLIMTIKACGTTLHCQIKLNIILYLFFLGGGAFVREIEFAEYHLFCCKTQFSG